MNNNKLYLVEVKRKLLESKKYYEKRIESLTEMLNELKRHDLRKK